MVLKADIDANDACAYLSDVGFHFGVPLLKRGIRQGRLPFGVVIDADETGGDRCKVFPLQLMAWAAERSVCAREQWERFNETGEVPEILKIPGGVP